MRPILDEGEEPGVQMVYTAVTVCKGLRRGLEGRNGGEWSGRGEGGSVESDVGDGVRED